eukprot:scaffold2066_cov68-Cyclotella_meneghiniana.AAC.25
MQTHSNTTIRNFVSLPLLDLPLRPSTLAHLLRCGFASTGDVVHALNMSTSTNSTGIDANQEERVSSNDRSCVTHFAEELGCDASKAADYVLELDDAMNSVGLPKVTTTNESKDSPPAYKTAASILKSKRVSATQTIHTRQIVSFCMPLDRLLGGGIPLSELTEIAGLPGVGKTQLCMQLAVDARLPAKQGGVEGCTVVIDSEGSWCGSGSERLYHMATSLVDHVKGSARRRAEAKRAAVGDGGPLALDNLVPEWFTAESILEGVHIFRVHDESSQTATLYSLPRFLLEQEEKGNPVKLVVIDSLAFHYRAAGSAARSKNRYTKNSTTLNNTYNLTRIATFLSGLASEYELAVVAMNHMTTRIDRNNTTGSGTKLVPALGESWAHSVTSRLIIDHYRRTNPDVPLTSDAKELRSCTLVKSPHKPPGTALFTITDKGIRGANAQLEELQQQQKRARIGE